MKSFRSKPVGWRNDSYRHSLAARGYCSKKLKRMKMYEWRQLPESVKKLRPELNPTTYPAKCDVCGVVAKYGDASCPNCFEGQMKYLAAKGIKTIDWKKAPVGEKYDAYGIDSKGRRVRLYGKEHSEAAAKAKFNRIERLNKKYQQIESKLKQDIDAKDDDKRENARATYVILKTGLRPGSYTDTKGDVKAFGLTTLKNKDVTVRKNTAEFKFIGKKGVEIEKKVTDPTVARIVKSQKKIGNKELFPNITDDSVRGYVQKFGKFKPKDFRTLYANMVAKKLVKQGLPKKEVVQKVAVELQNTPGVAAGSYIDPKVLR